MRNKKYWQNLTVMAMCTILICQVSIIHVHAADLNDVKQDMDKNVSVQDEADIEIDNNTPNVLTDEADINEYHERNIEEAPTIIPDIVNYTCTDDILLKFHNGTGYEALKNITEVVLFACESSPEEQNDAILTLTYEKDCFSYDLEKGELILKNDALKESILIPGKSYCVEICGNLSDGTPFEFEKSEGWIINYITSPKSDLKEDGKKGEGENEEEKPVVTEETEQQNLFSQIIDAEDHSEGQQYVLDFANANASISAAEMENLIGINQTKDIIIHTNDGVTFTFLKSSMKLVDGKETYDFGVELVTDRQQANVEMPNEDFVFRIKYHNTGELPGTAQVSIPVGNQWAGREVFYAAIDNRGILYMSTETVDTNGIYTIPDLWFTL